MQYKLLGELVNRKIGYGIVQPGQSVPNGVPVIKVNNLIAGLNSPLELDTTTHENDSKYSRTRLHGGELIISVVGTIGKTAIVPKSFDGCNLVRATALIDIDNELIAKWVKYYIDSSAGQSYIEQNLNTTVQPTLNIKSLVQMPIPFFDESIMKGTVSLLSSLDDKIRVNNKINDNLEQQAAALFESWFVNYDPWDGVQPSEWENAPLGSFVEIKRGGSPRPIQDFLSDSGLRWLKISDVTSLSSPFVLEIKEHIKEEGLRKTVFLHAGELVLSNSATPGIPKILDVDTCIHDGWLYFPKSELSKYYLYLFFKHIRKELVALGNGSVFTNLKTDILKAFPATKADEATLKEFDALVTPLFDAMLNADRENFKLATMRDALLPKLMSSEIDVSEVEL